MVGLSCQPVAVYSDGRDSIFFYFKLDAGVDGAALVFCGGENGGADQILQYLLGDHDLSAFAHIGKLRIVFGVFSGNGEGCPACPDGYLIVFIHNDGHRAFRNTADNVTKESCRQNAAAGLGHFRFDLISNGGFHIVAGEPQAVAGIAEDTLQGRKGALLGNGPGSDVQTCHQHTFFTGKTDHFESLFSENRIINI